MRKKRDFAVFRPLALLAAMGAAAASGPPARAADMFPEQRPFSNAQAGQTLARAENDDGRCLTGAVNRYGPLDASRAPGREQRAAAWLTRTLAFAELRAAEDVYGVEFRSARGVAVKLDAMPGPELQERLERISAGVLDAREALRGAGFAPVAVEVVLSDLGSAADGYALPAVARRKSSLVIDIEAPVDDLRRIAAHQYAHGALLASTSEIPAPWGEAFAVWSTQRLLGLDRAAELRAVDRRLGSLHEGLASDSPEHATGNAVWLTYLESRFGLGAVRATVEELGRGGAIDEALDRGVRRASTLALREAFADFQLWSLFTGSRNDGRHLRSAGRLADPRFTSSADNLPALSIRADPAVAPWGGSRVRLLHGPVTVGGGLRVDFEGDLTTDWEADLVLTSDEGAIHRLPLPLEDGRVEMTVPLDGLVEAVLLIRRLDDEDGGLRGYSYSAHREASYPFEIAEVHVEPVGDSGLLVQWETTQEHGVVGFNVLRARAGGGPRTQVNPVWVPALGAPDRGVGYRFLDTGVEPGVRYEYTIQAVTQTGLTSHSAVTPVSPR